MPLRLPYGRLFLAVVTIAGIAAAQVPADSLARRDSVAAADSSARARSASGVDTIVNYTARDSVIYRLNNRTMFMYGKGNIKYRELGLKAEHININWNTSLLHAQGVPDSTDTTYHGTKGPPELDDGGEVYHGSTIAYNFNTKKGKIDVGKTEIERGWYYGESIKKVEENVLFVGDGRYTTCEHEHPHYYFSSPEMKVLVGDKVVARPVSLYIDDVPVFALPFAIFPTKRGRRSGLIAPAFGQSDARGRYLTHLGYYWAMNDYMDLNLRADGFSKGGYTLYGDYRYALRYDFSGTISGSYGKTVYHEPGDPDYAKGSVFNIRINHNQQFDPTTQLVVDFVFTSAYNRSTGGNYYQLTSNNLGDLLRQNIVSNATLSKYWEGTPNSMTINVRRDQNLQPTPGTIELSEMLPSVSFNHAQSFPFRSGSGPATSSSAWYELLGVSYSGQYLSSRNTYYLDTLGNRRSEEKWGMQHQATINASPRLGYFTVTPFVNATSKWYDKAADQAYVPGTGVVTSTQKGFTTVNYFDMGVSLSTKLYGMVRPGIFGITGIRHQITPTVSYVYQPDFSSARWGYYGRYRDSANVEQTYNRFQDNVFGGAPSERRQAVTFRLGNVFEMKTEGDSVGKENKFTLLNLDLSTGYNFARDSLRFDEVGMSFRTAIGQAFTIGGSGSFNLYKFVPNSADPRSGRRINKFLLSEGKIADLTSFYISIGTHLSGEKKTTSAGPIRTPADSVAAITRRTYVGLYDQETPDFSIPWDLSLNWNFSQSQPDPRVKNRTSTISAALGFNLTEYWKISANASYDVNNRQFSAPQIIVYRDLHCWEMNFSWVPTGFARNFRLEIRLKAPQLQDIKIQKQGSAREVYGG